MKHVLVVCKVHPVLTAYLEEQGYTIHYKEALLPDQLYDEAELYEGIVTSTKIIFDSQLLDACKRLKWIARMGSGMEQIDLEYAALKGIYCCSSPEGNANAVAEQALGMYLCLKHNIIKSNRELLQGVWHREANRGYEIEGQTAGIIGLGNNGLRFAKKLSALGMKVIAYDIEKKHVEDAAIIQAEHIEQIYEHAQMVSFHVPYNKSTHHYFDCSFLESMQQPFILLNLSRGKVVNQETVLQGMLDGKILGAALDVWEREPLSQMPAPMLQTAQTLLAMPNFIGTPHIGGYTHEATYKMSLTLKNKLSVIFR